MINRKLRAVSSAMVGAASLVAVVGFAQDANASILGTVGLFNTGVDASGNALLPAGVDGVTDLHYTILNSSIGPSGGFAVTYENPAYAPADNATSRWISNSSNGGPGNGTVTFRTSFNLTSSSVAISGSWGTDNTGEIFLNGNDTGIGLVFGFPAFQVAHPFVISSGFTAGINYLDFVIGDSGPPLAFRVDDLSFVSGASETPLPPALFLFGTALAGLGFLARRRRGKASAFATL